MKRPWDTIAWWEIRRIPFNLAVLAAGITSWLVIDRIGSRMDLPGAGGMQAFGMLVGVIAYAIAANIFYSLGWIVELLWSNGDKTRIESLRPKAFRLGLIFSVLLTLLPAVLLPLAWAIRGFK